MDVDDATRGALPLPEPGERWALFLDVDGTLLAIAPTPDRVRVGASLPPLLERLAHHLDGALALVSGRRLADLDTLFHPFKPAAAGIHGLERRDMDGRCVMPPVRDLPSSWHRLLVDFADAHPGVRFEEKGASLALHYRLAPDQEQATLAFAQELVGDAARHGMRLRLLTGRCVVELLPEGAGKGGAIASFMREPPFAGRFPVFLGDDRTDEDGFAVIDELGGLSVKVGDDRIPTQARRRIADSTAVLAWLKALEQRLGALGATVTPMRRLVIVSNRVAVGTKAGTTGGLAVGLKAALRQTNGLWFGWSGVVSDTAPGSPHL
ncbi:MAG TPA: trehalose-phosphatase, partial [Stellaceae bacterium]|nr:trehalose-phosphatase [Stellaceae bacterium]